MLMNNSHRWIYLFFGTVCGQINAQQKWPFWNHCGWRSRSKVLKTRTALSVIYQLFKCVTCKCVKKVRDDTRVPRVARTYIMFMSDHHHLRGRRKLHLHHQCQCHANATVFGGNSLKSRIFSRQRNVRPRSSCIIQI